MSTALPAISRTCVTASRYSPIDSSAFGGGRRTPWRRPAMNANSNRAVRMPRSPSSPHIAVSQGESIGAPALWASTRVVAASSGPAQSTSMPSNLVMRPIVPESNSVNP